MLQVWKLEGTFSHSSCCSCSLGTSSPSSCSSTWDPYAHFFNQFSFQGAFDNHKPQTQAPEDPLSLGTSLCVIASLHWGKGTQTSICLSVFFIEKQSWIYLCMVPAPSDINFHLSSSIEKWLVSFSQPQLGSIIIHWLSGLFITRFKLKLHFRSLNFFFLNIKEF